MAAVFRPPLVPRSVFQPTTGTGGIPGKINTVVSSILKRPRSPEPAGPNTVQDNLAIKRFRTSTATKTENTADKKEKERKRVSRVADKEAEREEFRYKYTKAFPAWTFYFDTTDAERDALAPRILQLKGRVAKFFSNEVTHFITNRPIPNFDATEENKENASKPKLSGSASLRSPIKLRGLPEDLVPSGGYESLIRKAKQFGMKIWDTAKLNSVLERCCVPALPSNVVVNQPLRALLETEKRLGTTERDPTQKRHDFHYFSKGSNFALVEDMHQELATIAAIEYPVTRTSDGKETGSWPVAYCHPLSRGPFIEYNEKEERRREKQERFEKEREEERSLEIKKLKMMQAQRKQNDLRRTVSMSNLQRETTKPIVRLKEELLGLDDSVSLNNNASGFGSCATVGSYIAASGNSVSIASTYGTTSTMGAGSSMRGSLHNMALPTGLREQLQNQVLTSRRVGSEKVSVKNGKVSTSNVMMPPPEAPGREGTLLRRCKSTNTLRLGKRDEKTKPGYCESCRQKFDDFKVHIHSRRHQKFANNDANFIRLDHVLNRVRRQTTEDAEEIERQFMEDFMGSTVAQEATENSEHEIQLALDYAESSDAFNKGSTQPGDQNDKRRYIVIDDSDDDAKR